MGASDFAEPREKRIAELEQELAEYKEVFGSCETCKRTCDIDNAIQQANKGLDLDKIADEIEQDLK
jgi:CO dehydrogenase/acetyl-CoA synthase alpha subunit